MFSCHEKTKAEGTILEGEKTWKKNDQKQLWNHQESQIHLGRNEKVWTEIFQFFVVAYVNYVTFLNSYESVCSVAQCFEYSIDAWVRSTN